MLLVCLDDGRLSGGAPLSQNILSAENQKLTDTGGKFPHGEGALALDQILNAVGIPAHRTPIQHAFPGGQAHWSCCGLHWCK